MKTKDFTKSDPPSSTLKDAAWDPATGKLVVNFLKGTTYEYEKVPEAVVDALFSAPSAGAYFARNVAKSFTYKPLDPPTQVGS